MLFNSRKKPDFLSRIYSFFWPKTGWSRAWKYILLRVQRLPGTPSSIAKGFACGVAVSFTPFVGAHLAISGVVSWLIGGNVLAAFIGTVVGNPWTFPIIWVLIFKTGKFFLPNSYLLLEVDFIEFFKGLMQSIITFDIYVFQDKVWPILLTMIVGSIPYIIISWLLSFFFLKKFIYKLKKLREIRMKLKRKGFLKKRKKETIVDE